uniref:cytochrome b561 and DOMON domain-containing protein At5g35735-like n=1 Tax=Erigeron canadensis TaxID=72917 RepID=UPI001CB9BB62|nr:cytochrome b561 and DOMON domain-containing protein At5g35735-like [Erigeron canadensis]
MGCKILNLLLLIFISNIAVSYAERCRTYTFSSNTTYASCVSLPVLNSHLHWNYYNTNGTVDVAFRHTGSTMYQWVAWALNIRGSGMINAQALVALPTPNGSIEAYTSSVEGNATTLQRSALSFDVPAIRAERVGGDVIIYATLVLPNGSTNFNQVWQVGPVTNGVPATHALDTASRSSIGMVDFSTSQTGAGGSVDGSRQRLKNTHGVLCAISWGILMPIGVVTARYMMKKKKRPWFFADDKVEKKFGFYFHVTIQTIAYVLGVAGWATGLKLGGASAGSTHKVHRNIGITMFVFGTLQVLALKMRPKETSEFRTCWKFCHRLFGCLVIILSFNVFIGLDILDPIKKWKSAYIGTVSTMAAITSILEIATWLM